MMALEKTKLTKEKIIEIVTNDYGLLGTIEINYINRGTANIFKITVDDKKYILKEFNSERTLKYIEKEINIINYLSTKGISVPKYLQLKNGEYHTNIEDRIIIMQEFIEGEILEDNEANYEQLIKSATLLGKLIKALEEYPDLEDEDIINQKFSKRYLLDSIEKIEIEKNKIKNNNEFKEKFIEDYELKIKMAEELSKTFDFEIMNKLTIKNTHGDYCNLQLIYNDRKEITVIDFEAAKRMPIIWDIMRSYCYMDKDAKDGKINIKNLKEYVREVNKYVQLNQYDLKYAAYIFLIQLTGSVFGYREYNNNYEQKNLLRFALFRTKICKDLYRNSNKISNELLKILEEE
jgi:aminoglycoside phosphotransferase